MGRRVTALVVLALVGVACGTGDETGGSIVTQPIGTTTLASATTVSTRPMTTSTTTRAETTTTVETSTTEAPVGTVAEVVGWVQGWLDDQFERSDPPDGVVGPARIRCSDSGPVTGGDVLACTVEPQTAPGFELDVGGIVIYVLDASGPAMWEMGTDLPDTTERLADLYQGAAHGLLCRDLLSTDFATEAFPFSGVGRPDESAFFWSLVYWSLEGEPARMDADGNGIPCEILFEDDMVADVLRGGPVPLYLR